MARTALILGAGLGGVAAAEYLRKWLPRDHGVIAVDRVERHVFPPSLLWLMVGRRKPDDFTRPLDRLARHGVEFRRGDVTRIQPETRTVELNGRALTADALVIALGADYAPELVPGLADGGMCIYTMEGASRIHNVLAEFEGGRIAVLTAAPLYKCPAAPYETALLVDDFLRKRGVREKTEIAFFAAEPKPMVSAGPAVGAAVQGMIEARGIRYHPEHQVKTVAATERRLHFANGTTADYDLLLYVPPHRAPAVVREAGLTNESGWIPVDRNTLQTRFDDVYAIGDVTTIPLKMGRPLPKAGVFAHGEAEVVAHNIARAWTGEGQPRRFAGGGMCFVETGGGRAGFGRGNFFAEPLPQVTLHRPSPLWQAGKVLYEKYWLWKHF